MLRSSMVGLMVVALVLALAPAAAAAKPTTTDFYRVGARPGGVFQVVVAVRSPKDNPVRKGVVVVKMFVRKSGKWVLLEKDRTKAYGEDYFAVNLSARRVPRTGRCKVVARYRGTERWDPSKDVIRRDCNTRGGWVSSS